MGKKPEFRSKAFEGKVRAHPEKKLGRGLDSGAPLLKSVEHLNIKPCNMCVFEATIFIMDHEPDGILTSHDLFDAQLSTSLRTADHRTSTSELRK